MSTLDMLLKRLVMLFERKGTLHQHIVLFLATYIQQGSPTGPLKSCIIIIECGIALL